MTLFIYDIILALVMNLYIFYFVSTSLTIFCKNSLISIFVICLVKTWQNIFLDSFRFIVEIFCNILIKNIYL